MKVGAFNSNFNQSLHHTSKHQVRSQRGEFQLEERRMKHSEVKQDNLINQFWNLTDSMPRENQVEMAASVIAGRFMEQGITSENESFIKNISNRFSPEEIGNLKDQIKNHPKTQDKDISELERFFENLDKNVTQYQTGELNHLQKQQAKPEFRSPEEIFFQTTFNNESTIVPNKSFF